MGSAEYPFRCYAFVEDAYEHGGHIELDGQGATAREAAEAYGTQPGSPPRGSYVFYDCAGELGGQYRHWGHVGLALGDGQVIHAWNRVRIDAVHAIEALEPAPGWTPVATTLHHMHVR
ncbi:MAG: NlpC/P60 family protein [Anaerolineaceae bacterium]|nr:NlpC/P60 family protein [Anaerolineaceae bacterium]